MTPQRKRMMMRKLKPLKERNSAISSDEEDNEGKKSDTPKRLEQTSDSSNARPTPMASNEEGKEERNPVKKKRMGPKSKMR